MRYLIISICVFWCFTSCSLSTTKGLIATDPAITQYHNTYFSDLTQDYIYKAKIKAFDNNFGGILIIKKLPNQHHRIVFTTEFGNKIFDFEIQKNGFKTHYILKELDRGIVVKTLQRDFETLTQEYNLLQKKFENTTHLIYRSKQRKRYNHYFLDKKTKALQKIVHTTKSKEKTIFSFQKIEDNIVKNIQIQHKGLPLAIELFYLH